MKRLITFTGSMCLAAVLATAQTTSTTPGTDMKTTPQTPSTDPNSTGTGTQEGTAVSGQGNVGSQGAAGTQKEVKVEGCVQQSGSNYVLYSKKYKDGVQIVSSQDLSAHVGHEVRVRGNWTTPGSMASSQGMSSSSPHSAAHGSTTPETSSSSTPGSSTSSSTSGSAYPSTSSSGTTTPDTSASSSTGSTTSGTGSTSSSTGSMPSSSTSSTSDTSMQKPESDQPGGGSMRAISANSIEMVSASCKMKMDKNNQGSSTPR